MLSVQTTNTANALALSSAFGGLDKEKEKKEKVKYPDFSA